MAEIRARGPAKATKEMCDSFMAFAGKKYDEIQCRNWNQACNAYVHCVYFKFAQRAAATGTPPTGADFVIGSGIGSLSQRLLVADGKNHRSQESPSGGNRRPVPRRQLRVGASGRVAVGRAALTHGRQARR